MTGGDAAGLVFGAHLLSSPFVLYGLHRLAQNEARRRIASFLLAAFAASLPTGVVYALDPVGSADRVDLYLIYITYAPVAAPLLFLPTTVTPDYLESPLLEKFRVACICATVVAGLLLLPAYGIGIFVLWVALLMYVATRYLKPKPIESRAVAKPANG